MERTTVHFTVPDACECLWTRRREEHVPGGSLRPLSFLPVSGEGEEPSRTALRLDPKSYPTGVSR